MAETCAINFLTLVSYSTSTVIGGLWRLLLSVLMRAGVDLGRFHRLGLTLQLANPRLRDRGLSPVCVPSSSVNLTAHLTCDLTSFR